MQSIGITGVGSYLPEAIVSNAEIGHGAGVTDEWIVRKTGIRERRRAAPDQATSDLAAAAAERALRRAGLAADQLAYVVVATSTPDYPQPATAALVQDRIGARGAAAFDVNAVCSGFVYALKTVEKLLAAAAPGEPRHGLVIGADLYSRILDYADRRTAALFGDGAGAVVLGPVPAGRGLRHVSLVSHGDAHGLIRVEAGGSRLPASPLTVAEGGHYFRMDGRGVRAFVTRTLPREVERLLREAAVPPDAVRHFVPHQANGAMLADLWPDLGLRGADLHLTLERYANTGAASVPVTLAEMDRRGAVAAGDLVVLAAFGGGMSLGTALLDWTLDPAAPAPDPDPVPAGELLSPLSR
ncbi:ketoacyl-ACP synthase III [Streptomyces longwoodensis]|uniref:3-oxoacyl-ACP synthase III family protein n=1 Tax=Streptomyces longwoodensis TaxID=68231 RepID=UPI00224ED30B|nr:ketoacyl-ACP synthase III [Streptomyces longwoodensis]MCX4996802.1 ketoacyl-ACP synthase III [Streptomyces longwoodensis]WRY91469.1 ketoacyl-ACP synthase III [Streptomyces longwoodensis]